MKKANLSDGIKAGAGLKSEFGTRVAVAFEDLDNAVTLFQTTPGFTAESCTVSCRETGPVLVVLVGNPRDVGTVKRLFATVQLGSEQAIV